MTKTTPRQVLAVVLVDWKDTDGLLTQLRDALTPYGVVLQRWDLGTDDNVLTVADRRVTARALRVEMEQPDLTAEEIR